MKRGATINSYFAIIHQIEFSEKSPVSLEAWAVVNMRSVSERQLLVFRSFGTEMVGAKRSHKGAPFRGWALLCRHRVKPLLVIIQKVQLLSYK